MKIQLLVENFKISLLSILTHKLRSVITILIIVFGITALIGILTALEAIKHTLRNNFSQMGANTITISNNSFIHADNQTTFNSKILYKEATFFKNYFNFPSEVSLHSNISSTATLSLNTKKTHPNISVFGVDENYLLVSGLNLKHGRNFSVNEINKGTNAVIIGCEIYNKLFEENQHFQEQFIKVGANNFKVIGVLECRGSNMGFSHDNSAFLPIIFSRKISTNPNYEISILINDVDKLEQGINEATLLMRLIRKLSPEQKNNFVVSKSNQLADMLLQNIQFIGIAATLIGIITLIGAAIGLMNIMMVSVTDRTKEIGLRKAIGASSKMIKLQFLTESVIISIIGGVFGVVFGILAGNLISFIIKTPFIIPWFWIIFGLILCSFVGIISGYLPALKASKLDPIVTLRYE